MSAASVPHTGATALLKQHIYFTAYTRSCTEISQITDQWLALDDWITPVSEQSTHCKHPWLMRITHICTCAFELQKLSCMFEYTEFSKGLLFIKIKLDTKCCLFIRPQISDRQRSDEELRDHLLQRRLLPDVRFHPGGDHAAALHLPVSGGAGYHEECPRPAGPGLTQLRGAQGGDPLLRQGRYERRKVDK